MLCFLYARSGWRSWRSGQYPAPGAPVFFTTRIWTGGWARVSAIAVLMMGILALSMLAALLQYFVFSEVGLYMLGFRSCEAWPFQQIPLASSAQYRHGKTRCRSTTRLPTWR